MYRIDIHELETGRRVDYAMADSGSTHNQRSNVAERLIRTMIGQSCDYYVVEWEVNNEDGSEQVINKYRV